MLRTGLSVYILYTLYLYTVAVGWCCVCAVHPLSNSGVIYGRIKAFLDYNLVQLQQSTTPAHGSGLSVLLAPGLRLMVGLTYRVGFSISASVPYCGRGAITLD